MKVKIYLQEWFFNAGIIGFLKILDNAKDKFATMQDNYIEFDTEDLKKFHQYYFSYFFDTYNIADKLKNKFEKSFNVIKANLENETEDKKEQKICQDKVKQEKKYIKDNIKTQLDKIKKIDESTYNDILEQYNKIDKVDNVHQLEQIFTIINKNMYKENINKKITLNFFKSILSKSYFGQPSFLNVVKTTLSYEEQQDLFYKDYISNIVEMGYINDILEDRYTIEEIETHINSKLKDKLITEEMKKIYSNLLKKYIDNKKEIEEIKEYIENQVKSDCMMCGNNHLLTSGYSEGNFVPLAISSDNMKNFFWNQNAKIPICDACKLILFCTPVGITSISKTVKEIEFGKPVYKEKEIYSFVNYDTSVSDLKNTNFMLSAKSKQDKTIDNPYQEIILDIVKQEKELSRWKLDNIFVVEFEAEYLAYSRMEYFNIKRYIAEFFINYAPKTLNLMKDYRYKLQIVDYILKNKDIRYVINDKLRESIITGNQDGFQSFLAATIRNTLNYLKKGDNSLKEKFIKIKPK